MQRPIAEVLRSRPTLSPTYIILYAIVLLDCSIQLLSHTQKAPLKSAVSAVEFVDNVTLGMSPAYLILPLTAAAHIPLLILLPLKRQTWLLCDSVPTALNVLTLS